MSDDRAQSDNPSREELRATLASAKIGLLNQQPSDNDLIKLGNIVSSVQDSSNLSKFSLANFDNADDCWSANIRSESARPALTDYMNAQGALRTFDRNKMNRRDEKWQNRQWSLDPNGRTRPTTPPLKPEEKTAATLSCSTDDREDTSISGLTDPQKKESMPRQTTEASETESDAHDADMVPRPPPAVTDLSSPSIPPQQTLQPTSVPLTGSGTEGTHRSGGHILKRQSSWSRLVQKFSDRASKAKKPSNASSSDDDEDPPARSATSYLSDIRPRPGFPILRSGV